MQTKDDDQALLASPHPLRRQVYEEETDRFFPTASTCCKLCGHCPGFVSTSSSDYYTCYNCKHHKDHHFC